MNEKKTINPKQIAIYTAAGLLNLLLAVLFGMLFLYLAFRLPTDRIAEHVARSAEVIKEEGTYPVVTEYATSQLDNFTDSIMLLEAADDTEGSRIERAVFVYHGVIDDLDCAQVLVSHYSDGTEFTGKYDYSRYWHGYLTILKPLLLFFDYSGIRILNGIVQVLLTVAILFLLYKREKKEMIIPYLLVYLMLMPLALQKSMQFSTCFYLFSVGVLALLIFRQRTASVFVFLNLGILTAYFDFLTYPVAVFGIPAGTYLILNEEEDGLTGIKDFVRNGILWCIGYGGMWASKWILGSMLTGVNLFDRASTVFKQRTASTSADGLTHYGIIYALKVNAFAFLKTPVTILLILFILYLIIRLIYRANKREIDFKSFALRAIPFVLLAFVPIAWYIFARNHSAIHYWFSNKACAVTLLACLSVLVYRPRNPKKESG